jgi:hypothetical protein
MRKLLSLILCAALIFAIYVALTSSDVKEWISNSIQDLTPEGQAYNKALELIENGKYEEAKIVFEQLGDYRDSEDYLSKFYYMPISFEYDLVGKKGTNPVTYNSMNLPSAETTKREDVDAVASFEYDENGNIIKQIMTNYTAETVDFFDYIYDSGDVSDGHGGILNGKQDAMTYFGDDEEMYHQPFSQGEDRLVSKKASIPNADRIIRRIDVYIDPYKAGEEHWQKSHGKELTALIKNYKDKINFYDDRGKFDRQV